MKQRTLTRLILVGGLLGGLAACGPDDPGPIAGGPCSYETSVIEGTVTEVDEDGALFMGEEGGVLGAGLLSWQAAGRG